jgi:hypothetical protein
MSRIYVEHRDGPLPQNEPLDQGVHGLQAITRKTTGYAPPRRLLFSHTILHSPYITPDGVQRPL